MDNTLNIVAIFSRKQGVFMDCCLSGPRGEAAVVENIDRKFATSIPERADRARFEVPVKFVLFGSDYVARKAFKEFKRSGLRAAEYRVSCDNKSIALITIASSIDELPEEARAVWRQYGPK